MTHGKFNLTQQQQLIKGLNADRVEKRSQGGMKLSYLAQHDVRAHLIRLFGYGHFDLITESTTPAYEQQQESSKGGKLWNVGYRVTMRLVIRDADQNFVCCFSESAVGSALSADRGEAHDNAVKNGSSDAMKRCAINLGDQFGLSLYQGGQTAPIVRGTLVVDGHHDTAPETAKNGPVSDEQPPVDGEEGDAASRPSAAALEAGTALFALATLPAGERITEVAKFKSANPELLSATLEIDGQTVTVARYADLIAAGKFSEQEK